MLSHCGPWCGALLLGLLLAIGQAAPAEQPAPADRAVLVVRLPADATLIIGSSTTLQTGAERTFLSPELPTGKTYRYQLKATWTEAGQARSLMREALVKAGERTTVDFSAAEPAAQAKAPPAGEPAKAGAPKTRTFLFTYGATVSGLKAGETARIWLPVPPSNESQEVKLVAKELPAPEQINREPEYGNQILYVEAKAGADGTIPLKVTYRVARREVHGGQAMDTDEARQIARFLQPDAKVPVGGKPLELLKGKEVPADQVAAAHLFYDVVDDHMRYSKEGTGWGQGDAVWACDSKYGNCSDFHSLFISLARSQQIPAKFIMGFPLPPKHGSGDVPGYHCWAMFRPAGKGWIPVDISEANKNPTMRQYYFGNLTEDRVAFSTGRDLVLVPKQDGPPLNFLIYPYVEVGGKALPADRVQRKFTYQDVN